jgi:hypothetical protein
VRAELLPEPAEFDEALVRSTLRRLSELTREGKGFPVPLLSQVVPYGPGRFADAAAPYLSLDVAARQGLLETLSPGERIEKLHKLLSRIGDAAAPPAS